MEIKIGTRKSKLAIVQAEMTAQRIKFKFPHAKITLVPISTKGDRILDKPLSQIGGKGLFVTEIEKLLLTGEIDIAVHSGKDLPVELGNSTEISGVLPRGNYRDALVTLAGKSFSADSKFTVGTGSLRRRINLKGLFPNVDFEEIRGNVDTRIAKLKSGEYDGIVLATAGIERLGISDNELKIQPFDYQSFIPAPCQGIIAVQCVTGSKGAEIAKEISDPNTFYCFQAEREAIKLLEGDCGKPIGAFSYIREGKIFMRLTENSQRFADGNCEISDKAKLVRELISKL